MVTTSGEAGSKEWQAMTTKWGNLPKYTPIFLLLAVTGLVFLLRNINTLEKLNCETMSTLYKIQSRFASTLGPVGPLSVDQNQSFCAHLGLLPSPEEAQEERYLLESIAWPGPRPLNPPALHQSSDPAHSSYEILPVRGEGAWHVGDQLEVNVHMKDFQGEPKRYGGDFLLARLHSPELGAGVAGQVVDHRNGTYSAVFLLLWAGLVQVEVTLVHPSEAVAVLQRLRADRPDRVFFKSLFRSGFLSETTVCNLCLPANQQPQCNYTDLHTGEPWYCYKPKLLSCDKRVNHAKGGYQKHLLTVQEAPLFQSGVNIKVPIRASGPDRVTVLPDPHETVPNGVRVDSVKATPSGYYFQGSWRVLGGVPMRQFNDSSAITHCLQGKVVYMLGDSTVRQWFEYLNAFVPDMKEFNLHSAKNVGPYMSVDSAHNILLKYRCHGPPIRFSTVLTSELRYVANELEGLPGGPHTVVVLSVWSHFSTFPVEVYVRRLRVIRHAVVRLLERSPGTLVMLRSANPQALDPEVSLYNSDWFSAQLDAVLRAMFKGLDVLLVDAWEMTLASHHPHDLHPPPAIVKNMIDIVLSYICPERRS